jgi:hypothetical protein
MLKSWIIAVAASLVAIGVQAVDGDPVAAHKIDCQHAPAQLSALRPTHHPVTYNKSTQCGMLY